MGNCFPFFPVICRLGVSSHWLYVSPILRVILLQVLLVTLLAYSVPWRARTHLPARRQKQNAPEWLGGAGRCTNSPIQFIAPPHREVSCCILLCVFSTEWIIACQCQPLSTVKSILSISWRHYKLALCNNIFSVNKCCWCTLDQKIVHTISRWGLHADHTITDW